MRLACPAHLMSLDLITVNNLMRSTNYEAPKLQTLASTLRFAVTSASDASPPVDKTRGPKSYYQPTRWWITPTVWDIFTRKSVYVIVSLWRGPLCPSDIDIHSFVNGSTAHCWTCRFSASLSYTQLVGLLGRGINPSQGHYLTQTQNKRTQTSMLRVGFEPTTPCARAGEEGSCLRPRGHCGRLRYSQAGRKHRTFLL
jgi:hypothetical protein